MKLDRTLRYLQFSLLDLQWSKQPYVWSFCLLFKFSVRSFSLFGPMLGNQFFISCFKHVLGNLFAFILASLTFFLQSCVVHYFVIVVVLVFLDILVNQLFYIFEHLFILVEDRQVKILSFCVFLSPRWRGFPFEKRNLVWATSLGALPNVPRGAAIFSTEDSLPIRWCS